MAGLKAWRIDKHELRRADRTHTGDAVPRGLRLAGGNTDFLPHQSIEQGRFADVGFANNRDQATALGFHRRCA